MSATEASAATFRRSTKNANRYLVYVGDVLVGSVVKTVYTSSSPRSGVDANAYWTASRARIAVGGMFDTRREAAAALVARHEARS